MATELAKAYVQIMPSAEGIKGKIEEILGKEIPDGEESGEKFGSGLVSKIKSLIAAAGIGAALKAAISEGAALEQSIGGVETLFKDSADTVIANAQRAYQTAGMSANAYMESVTGFSASLLQGLGGDTARAAAVADMAMTDMSDNANKMGTDMSSIQNAYQGFAKQNYTMLDNLKLGYGGTKTEMERLLKDATELSGVEYNLDNLSDVYEAIHVIQENLDITGTTAKEASSTISGSLASVKAAAQNVLGYLTTGLDVGPAIEELVQTGTTFLFGNLVPALGNIITALPGAVSTFVQTAVPLLIDQAHQLLTTGVQGIMSSLMGTVSTEGPGILQETAEKLPFEVITERIATFISDKLPEMAQHGVTMIVSFARGLLDEAPATVDAIGGILDTLLGALIDAAPRLINSGVALISGLATGILKNMPAVITNIGTIISKLLSRLLEAAPSLLKKGFELISRLASGILKNLPAIVSSIAQVIAKILFTIGSHLPEILQKGIELLGKLLAGIIKAIPQIPGYIMQVVSNIKSAFTNFDWAGIGKNIINGIANGIKNFAGNIVSAAKTAAQNALSGAKKLLGIKSPSRVFRDQVGKNISLGMAEGISAAAGEVLDEVDELSTAAIRAADIGPIATSVTNTTTNTTEANDLARVVELIQQLLALLASLREMGVYLDADKLVGGIAPAMSVALGRLDARCARGY